MVKSFGNILKKKSLKNGQADAGLDGNEKLICYVLISCYEPKNDGSMQVEMTYEGDKILASYLIKSAQGMIDKE